jgi:site-specific recombinase XerD
MRHLMTLALWAGAPLDRLTPDGIRALLNRIQQSHYAEWTKHDLRVALKKLCRWMTQTGRSSLDPSSIRARRVPARTTLPNDLLTPEDVMAMVAATSSARTKAFIVLLYETGARIGEVAPLRIRDLAQHPSGMEVHLPREGKTGARRVLVVTAVPFLKAWLNCHPYGQHPDALLWCVRNQGRPVSYAALAKMLRKAARAARLSKRVNPHKFRHSRATYLANHLTEAQMNQFFGWRQGSDMPSTYVHLSGRDVDDALLHSYGLPTASKAGPSPALVPRTCTQCHTENPATNSFCGLCGLPLDGAVAQAALKQNLDRQQADGIMDQLIQDEEFRAMVDRKLRELRIVRA